MSHSPNQILQPWESPHDQDPPIPDDFTIKLNHGRAQLALLSQQLTAEQNKLFHDRRTEMNEAIFKDRYLEQVPTASYLQLLLATFKFRDYIRDLQSAHTRFNLRAINKQDLDFLHREALKRFHEGLNVPSMPITDIAK